jgi:uncharacterized protein
MNSPAPGGQADMEEILSSIRSSLEEETGRVAREQTGAPAEAVEAADDVLELDDADMLPEGEELAADMVVAADIKDIPSVEEIFDINAFATEGREAKVKAEDMAELKKGLGEDDTIEPVDVAVAEQAAQEPQQPAVQEQAASDDFDRLLNELQSETVNVADAPAIVDIATEPVSVEEIAVVAVEEVAVTQEAAEPADVLVDAITEAAAEDIVQDLTPAAVPVGGATRRVQLAAIPGVSGLQVALPAEILAEALRPLVKDWVAENLPQVVERLVADEIEKLVKD